MIARRDGLAMSLPLSIGRLGILRKRKWSGFRPRNEEKDGYFSTPVRFALTAFEVPALQLACVYQLPRYIPAIHGKVDEFAPIAVFPVQARHPNLLPVGEPARCFARAA